MNETRPLIAYAVSDLADSNDGRYLLQLTKRLDQERFRLVVICLDHPGSAGAAVQRLGVPLYNLDLPTDPHRLLLPWWRFVGLVQLRAFMRKLRPRLVHTVGFQATLWGRIAARMWGVPSVVASFGSETKVSDCEAFLARLTSGAADLNLTFGARMAWLCRHRWDIHPRRIVAMDPRDRPPQMASRHARIYAELLQNASCQSAKTTDA